MPTFKVGDMVVRVGGSHNGMEVADVDVVTDVSLIGSVTLKKFGRGHSVGSLELWAPAATAAPPKPALDVQVGGGHYKDMAIQPVEYITKNNLGFIEGNVVKYISRWRKKNGVQDLEKARHFIDLLIQSEKAKQ